MHLPPVLTLLLMLFLSSPVWATTYWVSGSLGSAGNCGNSQGSSPPANYLRTINGGIACLSAGDTLMIRSGTYSENVVLNRGGSSGNPLTIRSTEGAIIDPPGTTVGIFLNTDGAERGYALIEGLDIRNGSTGITARYYHDLTIRNMKIHDMDEHGFLGAVGNFLFENNTIYNTGVPCQIDQGGHNFCHGVYLNGYNIKLINNIIYKHNNGSGIQTAGYVETNTAYSYADNVQIYNNVIDGTGTTNGPAIFLWGATGHALNNLVKNNIFYQNANTADVLCLGYPQGHTIQNNLSYRPGGGTVTLDCTDSTITNNPTGNPGFVGAAGGNYRISASGSPANNAGVNLSSVFTTDADGWSRPSSGAWTIGAYEFLVTPPPTPIGNFATYTFDENTGTSAGDTSGQGHTLTLSSAGWGPPIIGVSSLATDGTRFASVPLTAGMMPATTVGLVGWWSGTTPATCDMISLGDSAVVRLNSDGTISGFFYNGSNWPIVSSNPINLFDGQSYMVWMTKSPTAVRVGVNTAPPSSTLITGTITYTLGNQLVIGKHGDGAGFVCPPGRIDMVRFFDTELTPTAILNLYNEQVPSSGLSVTHVGWFAANAPEGVSVGAIDTNLNQLISAPVGVRWSIHKADPGTLTEYFRPFCRVFSTLGALMLDWTEITNSFGSTGIRLYGDSVVTTGTPTSVLLPTDGFTGVAGLYVDNPADTTSPYDAAQRITLNQAGHAELEAKIEFGSPRVATERVECRPQRENGTPFTSYMGSLP